MMRGACLALVAAAVLGCGVPVAVERDPGARYGAWKSWSWLPRSPVARGDTAWTLIDERVRSSFEREMKARGLRKVERERPDFLVTYYAALDAPIDAKAIAYAAGGPLGARSAANAMGQYEQGSLLLDVLDAKSGKLVWRGAGRRVIEPEQTPAERRERIDAAVVSMVDEFTAR
ncbi:MAG: hypothetical protein DCC71_11740 [Proteobacteria bacterium]|nr:MAG: hypothetical protein DCC71_11740 [Pseudomonadota bacterium]